MQDDAVGAYGVDSSDHCGQCLFACHERLHMLCGSEFWECWRPAPSASSGRATPFVGSPPSGPRPEARRVTEGAR